MPVLRCPKCASDIETSDVNVAKDVMFCRSCSQAYSLSALVTDRALAESGVDREHRPQVDPRNPPAGAWFRDHGTEYQFGATTRSLLALFLVPFMLVWSGGALGGIYGSQIISGKFSLMMSLFGIPFLIGSVVFWALALMTIWGRVDITIRGDDGIIFTGVGPVGYRQRFHCSEIAIVREDVVVGDKGARTRTIVLEGGKRLKFGSMLNEERRYFVMEVLKTMINPAPRRM